MLTYSFLFEQNDELVFAYYPEGDISMPGKVAITSGGDGRVIEDSKADFGKRYAYHAINGIDISKKSGTVAWY